MTKKYWIILIVIALVIIALIFFYKKGQGDKRSEIKAALASSGEPSDWVDKLTPTELDIIHEAFTKYQDTIPEPLRSKVEAILKKYGMEVT